MTDKLPEALIRADELEAIGAESSLARAMAAHTIRLLYKENEALRARLSQPEQKPVVWRYRGNLHEFDPSDWASGEVTPLYTAPQQREWVGLTDEEILEEYRQSYGDDGNLTDIYFARAIEAKLKEKSI